MCDMNKLCINLKRLLIQYSQLKRVETWTFICRKALKLF